MAAGFSVSSFRIWKPRAVRIGCVTSPGFIFSIICCSAGETSDSLIGPIRPPLAFDADAEISAATLPKSSPSMIRARTASIFSRRIVLGRHAHHRLPALRVAGTSMMISRSVTRRRLREVLFVREVVLPRFFLGDRQLRADFILLDVVDHERLLDVLAQVLDRHPLLLERRLELLIVFEFFSLRIFSSQALNCSSLSLYPFSLPIWTIRILVDGVDEHLAGHFVDGLLQLFVVLQRLPA